MRGERAELPDGAIPGRTYRQENEVHYYLASIYGLIDLENRKLAQQQAQSSRADPPEPAHEPYAKRSPASEAASE